jgi:transcriptional regulator with GAF, ATPase, and Fis domain
MNSIDLAQEATSCALLGTSEASKRLAGMLDRLARSDASVLLRGETGTGKSFVARLIHERGPRAAEPLRVLNCAAIPDALFESELFGHERGAFTGAVTQRIGALEAAGRGTLFLDEIGELSLVAQAKLLRALC